MARTRSPLPAKSASSSITSVWIKVESISKHTRGFGGRCYLLERKYQHLASDISWRSYVILGLSSIVPETDSCNKNEDCPPDYNGSRTCLLIESIFNCWSDIIFVTAANCLAANFSPRILIMYRCLDCVVTHFRKHQ
jgi:hypothetical protein